MAPGTLIKLEIVQGVGWLLDQDPILLALKILLSSVGVIHLVWCLIGITLVVECHLRM